MPCFCDEYTYILVFQEIELIKHALVSLLDVREILQSRFSKQNFFAEIINVICYYHCLFSFPFSRFCTILPVGLYSAIIFSFVESLYFASQLLHRCYTSLLVSPLKLFVSKPFDTFLLGFTFLPNSFVFSSKSNLLMNFIYLLPCLAWALAGQSYYLRC